MPRLTAALSWLFRDRASGRIVVVQVPNVALWIAAAAWATDLLVQPTGSVATIVHAVQTGALVFWAGDEILRGVNPWRRLLGAGVLVGLAVTRLA